MYHELVSLYEKDNTNYIMLRRLCKLWFPAYRRYSVSIDGVEVEGSVQLESINERRNQIQECLKQDLQDSITEYI